MKVFRIKTTINKSTFYLSGYSFSQKEEEATYFLENEFRKEFTLKKFDKVLFDSVKYIYYGLYVNPAANKTGYDPDLELVLKKICSKINSSQYADKLDKTTSPWYWKFHKFPKEFKKDIIDAIFSYFDIEEFELSKPTKANPGMVWLKAWNK